MIKEAVAFALFIYYFLCFFVNYGHNGHVVFLGCFTLWLVWFFLVADTVHAPSYEEYDGYYWEKNYPEFTAFMFAF
jgi:hypothetical protein